MEMKTEDQGCLVSNSATFRDQRCNNNNMTAPSFKPASIVPPQLVRYHPRYRECLKNHAASSGGNVLDGCGEFMPGSDDNLKCAACNCHRNFHRKEQYDHLAAAPPPILQLPPPPPHRWSSFVSPMKMAFGGGGGSGSGGGGSESSSEELNFNGFNVGTTMPLPPPPYGVLSKKRFRTKFTQDQKMKMLEFAEKVGWRIPREDDVDVQRFCAEVGVKRQVFKVWMHNNKSSTKKQIQLEEES